MPMTRIESMVCGCWARAAPAVSASTSTIIKRARRLVVRAAREMEVCLIFTGLEPCGEHKFWCDPKFVFTGRISTPSLLKIWSCLAERLIILDRGHPAQTARAAFGSEIDSFQKIPCRACRLRTWV